MILAVVGLGLVTLTFLLSALLCGLARRWAPRWGFVDKPGGHKGHRAPTPLGGGVAIWLATVAVIGLGAAVAGFGRDMLPERLARHVGGFWFRSGELAEIFGLATVIMVMGLTDDRRPLDWQAPARGAGGAGRDPGRVGGPGHALLAVHTPGTGGGGVGPLGRGTDQRVQHARQHGRAGGGVGLIAALLFVGAQVAVGSLFVPAVLLVLVGALGGFLVHNRHPARLFMGDAGSNFLGFLLGALTVAGTYFRYEPSYSPYSVLAPLLVMAVPLYDMMSVIVIRLREGRSPFRGDRRHFSHRLVERGLTPPQAVRTIDLVTLAGGLGALLLHRLAAGRGVRGRRADGLPARGGGPSGGLPDRRPPPQPHRDRSKFMARQHPEPRVIPRPKEGTGLESRKEDGDAEFAARLGEWLRRIALGLTAALMTARAYWPSEADYQLEAGTGLDWVWAMLMVAGLAIGSALVGGTLRVRWSWTDAAVIALMFLVGLSATHALDRRTAINLAWEWAALGLAYVLVRNLPRTRAESAALVGALVATAVAIAAYGLLSGRRRTA